MSVRIGIVGVGRMGYRHARIIAEFLPNAQLVGIADVEAVRASSVARLLGVQHWHDNHQDLFARTDVDAVVIAAPSKMHPLLVQDAVRAGKPIFCEKPLALNLEDTDATISAVEAAGIPLQVGFQYHFLPAYVRARAAIEAGEIGMPLMFRALQRDEGIPSPSFCDPSVSGGILVDMGIHEFDLARWFFNDEVVEVYAIAPPTTHADIVPTSDLDRALVSLRFRSGAVGSVEVARNSHYPDESRHDVLGSAGTILLGQMPQTNIFTATPTHMQAMLFPEHNLSISDAYRYELEAFVHCIQTGVKPSVDGHTSRAALQIALAAYESLRTGSPVRV